MAFYDPTNQDSDSLQGRHPNTTSPPWLLPPLQMTCGPPAFVPQYQATPSSSHPFSSSAAPFHSRPLYTSIPLPPSKPTPVRTTHLCHYLTQAVINWNIRTPPASASCSHRSGSSRSGGRRSSWQEELAMVPPLSFMVLRVEGCSNTITVFPGAPERGFVTVMDVLDHIHRAPQCALGAEAECDCARCSSYDVRARHARSRSQAEVGSIPRASVLMGSTLVTRPRPDRIIPDGSGGVERWWMGLVPSATESEVWNLLIDVRRGQGRMA